MNYFLAPGLSKKDFPVFLDIRPEEIHQIVCPHVSVYLGEPVTPKSMKHKNNGRPFVYARQLSMFFTKKHCIMSLKSVGESVSPENGKPFDHCTVLFAKRRVEELVETDKKYAAMFNVIAEEINLKIISNKQCLNNKDGIIIGRNLKRGV